MKHKHCSEIIAWAEGKPVQFYNLSGQYWQDIADPVWDRDVEYRVKPESRLNTATVGDVFPVTGTSCARAGITLSSHINAIEVYAESLEEAIELRNELLQRVLLNVTGAPQ